jgi:hypothetical protein
MDPVADKALMWIAREGLKAPLPKGWKPWCADVCVRGVISAHTNPETKLAAHTTQQGCHDG